MVPVIKRTFYEHYYDVILDAYHILLEDEVVLYPSGTCNKKDMYKHYYDVILDPYLILVKDEVDNILYPSGTCNKKDIV